jgi:hypothetical protein
MTKLLEVDVRWWDVTHREIQKLVPQVMNKYELKGRLEVLAGDLVPIQIKVLLEEEEPTEEEEERALILQTSLT